MAAVRTCLGDLWFAPPASGSGVRAQDTGCSVSVLTAGILGILPGGSAVCPNPALW